MLANSEPDSQARPDYSDPPGLSTARRRRLTVKAILSKFFRGFPVARKFVDIFRLPANSIAEDTPGTTSTTCMDIVSPYQVNDIPLDAVTRPMVASWSLTLKPASGIETIKAS